jgi:hypothetical protein
LNITAERWRNSAPSSELAGKSVAVPFVGTTAASLVIAEAIRLLHHPFRAGTSFEAAAVGGGGDR